MSILHCAWYRKISLITSAEACCPEKCYFVRELLLRVTSVKVLVLPWCTSYTSDFKIVLSVNVDLYTDLIIRLPYLLGTIVLADCTSTVRESVPLYRHAWTKLVAKVVIRFAFRSGCCYSLVGKYFGYSVALCTDFVLPGVSAEAQALNIGLKIPYDKSLV